MGNKASLKYKSVKYFKELNSQATIINYNELKEQVQLSVSLENCTKGIIYSFAAYFLEKNNKKLLGTSEKLTASDKGSVKFQDSFLLTYPFENQQNLQF